MRQCVSAAGWFRALLCFTIGGLSSGDDDQRAHRSVTTGWSSAAPYANVIDGAAHGSLSAAGTGADNDPHAAAVRTRSENAYCTIIDLNPFETARSLSLPVRVDRWLRRVTRRSVSFTAPVQ